MKELLKTAREQKKIKTRELAKQLAIDQALISKFENGNRMPTREQISKLAAALDIDYETLLTSWLKEKILEQIVPYDCGEKALKMALDDLKSQKSSPGLVPKDSIEFLLQSIEALKNQMHSEKEAHHISSPKKDEFQAIFKLLQWSSHSFSLKDIEEFLEKKAHVHGKSMKEHLEVSNSREAFRYLQLLSNQGFDLNESEIVTLHQILHKNLGNDMAGSFRTTAVLNTMFQIKVGGNEDVKQLISGLIRWYKEHKSSSSPLELASSLFLKFIWIHPFTESNEKIAVFLFAFVLFRSGYGWHILELSTEFIQRVEYTFEKQDTTAFYIHILLHVKNQLELSTESN